MQDKGWLTSIKRQLQSRNYEAFLSEMFAAYFVEKNLGFEIAEWNPKTKMGRDVEFRIKYKSSSGIFCEVKSPGWQGQLDKGDIQSGRAKQKKYSTFPEARVVEPYKYIQKTISKSYKKFLSDRPNLLIITDNLFQPISMGKLVDWYPDHKMPKNIWYALYNSNPDLYDGPGCFITRDYENLSGVLFLNDRFLGKLFAWFEDNKNAKTQLPKEFISKALKLNEKGNHHQA